MRPLQRGVRDEPRLRSGAETVRRSLLFGLRSADWCLDTFGWGILLFASSPLHLRIGSVSGGPIIWSRADVPVELVRVKRQVGCWFLWATRTSLVCVWFSVPLNGASISRAFYNSSALRRTGVALGRLPRGVPFRSQRGGGIRSAG